MWDLEKNGNISVLSKLFLSCIFEQYVDISNA